MLQIKHLSAYKMLRCEYLVFKNSRKLLNMFNPTKYGNQPIKNSELNTGETET